MALRRVGQFPVATADFDQSQICAYVGNNPSSIILLKNDHPDVRCLELIGSISRTFGNAKILVLGDAASDQFVVSYLEAGAQGYLPEEISVSDVAKAIDQVAKGEVVCSQSVAPSIFGRLANLHDENWHLNECESQVLTLRESEILELMAGGLTNGQIADRLSISAHTVKNHVHNILAKLQVNRRILAVQEVYGRRWLNVGAANGLSSPSNPKSPSSVGNEALTTSPKHRSFDVVRGHWVGH